MKTLSHRFDLRKNRHKAHIIFNNGACYHTIITKDSVGVYGVGITLICILGRKKSRIEVIFSRMDCRYLVSLIDTVDHIFCCMSVLYQELRVECT